MSPTRLFQRYKIEIAFIFAILVLLAAGISSYRALESARSSAGWVRHTYQVIGTIDELVESLAIVHSSYRSFALTGDEQQLASNRSAAERAAATRDQLANLTRDNPEQQERLSEIERLSNRLMQRSDEVISTRRNKGADTALDLLRSGEGSRALEQFRRVTGELKDRELRLLEVREQQANDDFTRTQMALALATLLGLILTASAGIGNHPRHPQAEEGRGRSVPGKGARAGHAGFDR